MWMLKLAHLHQTKRKKTPKKKRTPQKMRDLASSSAPPTTTPRRLSDWFGVSQPSNPA